MHQLASSEPSPFLAGVALLYIVEISKQILLGKILILIDSPEFYGDPLVNQTFVTSTNLSSDRAPMPARRSPRSVERFCKGLQLESLASEQIAVLLSLAQLSGWSADRIALKIYDLYHVNVTAEQIWNLYWKWILNRDGSNELEDAEQAIAECVLSNAGITLTHSGPNGKRDYVGRPLSETTQPVSLEG